MNECPFCGGTLDCSIDDIWICRNCDEAWVRVTALAIPSSEMARNICKLLNP